MAEKRDEKTIIAESTMRFRSTGLGKTTLYGNVDSVTYKDGALLIKVNTTLPVLWQIRVVCSFKGLWKIIFASLRVGVLSFVFGLRKGGWPKDF